MSSTLTERVVEQLLGFIRKNHLVGGEELPTEVELMEMLQVSRGVLREALSHLKAFGIISSRRGSSFRVEEPELVDAVSCVIRHLVYIGGNGLLRLYRHHRFMELGCIWDAVLGATDEQCAQLEQARARYEEVARAARIIPLDVDLAEIEFHQAMTAPAQCPSLIAVNGILHELFEQRLADQWTSNYTREYVEGAAREHNMLTDAFTLRVPEAAYSILRRHLAWGEKPFEVEPELRTEKLSALRRNLENAHPR